MKAVIFDLDGTLADSVESIAHSANIAIGEFGFAPNPVEDYNRFAGDGAAEMLKRSLIAAGDRELEYFERVKKKYAQVFEKECMYRVKPYDDIPKLLDELKKRNIKLSVLSNKPHERAVDVVTALFGGSFDIIVGQSDAVKRKPDPEGAFYIADKLNIKPSECVYVGDTNTDMKTGKAAHMLTVGVLWGYRDRKELEENGADVIIGKPLELIDVIEGEMR